MGERTFEGVWPARAVACFTPRGLSEEMADCLQWAFPVIPLTGFPAFTTAFSNDAKPEYVFAPWVMALGRPEDVLVALSTAGNSTGVCQG